MGEYIIIKNKGKEFSLYTSPLNAKYDKYTYLDDNCFRKFDIETNRKKVFFGLITKKEIVAHVGIKFFDNETIKFKEVAFDLFVLPSELEKAKRIEALLKPFIVANLKKDDYENSHHIMWVTLNETSDEAKQKILKDIVNGKIKFENIKRKEINNKIYVYVNDLMIGCIPDHHLNMFKEYAGKKSEIIDYEIFDGKGKDKHGVKRPYQIRIKYSFSKN